MGWYIRKAFNLGPLRLNLSKRGLGFSAGVKGARIGVDAAGKPYAAGGRYGLYFRERLGRGRAPHAEAAPSAPSPPPAASDRPPRHRWALVVVLACLAAMVVVGLLAWMI